MKKIYLSILMAVASLSATAQDFNVNAIVIYKSDGTQDTVSLAKRSSFVATDFYGKENPVDNDYIQLAFTLFEDNSIGCRAALTELGVGAPYTAYGVMFSSNHIDGVPQDHVLNQLYFVDTKQWYKPDTYTYYASRLFFTPQSVMNYFALVPGQTYFARAYYVLDERAYYSSEVEVRAAKTVQAVVNYSYADYYRAADNVAIKIDAESIINDNTDLFGTATDNTKQMVLQYAAKVLGTKSTAELQAMASNTEECEDGTLYIINETPAALVAEVVQAISDDMQKPYYMQASLSSVYEGKSTNTEFGTYNCAPIMIMADAKWDIMDNQYLSVVPNSTISKPRLAFEMNYIVQAGKTYDITLTVAPNTQNEADTTKTYFTVYIASLNDEGAVPKISEAQAFGTDTIISNKPIFIAKAMEQKQMTMQFKARNFTNKLYLQLDHNFSFFSSANRAKYGQDFRVVGIEIKPHEE